MRYTILNPPLELKDFVSHFWISSTERNNKSRNTTENTTACSLANIIIGFKGSEENPSPAFTLFQGQTSFPKEIQISKNGFFKIFGIAIYPHTIYQLFNILASEVNNQSIPISSFWSTQENLLSEMIANSLVTPKCINILSNYLHTLLLNTKDKDQIVINAAKQIRQINGNLNIEKLSREFCLSQKQFSRRFKKHIGFTPKLYARIVRFESVFYNILKYSNFTQAAYASGYYDQSHFIQDFRVFTGYSPNKFFALSNS
ncbi:helix-turn-helix domain-containing protein [Carboxylicivirga linearis]|uniref:AraC family transcriptional regulator n=1 Tax=Carboxylicivirga linearis TaxID=1628157 RepID=A0ABS5K198_9BACT|nr:helix-turn-helix domain-containing protein [Carboxylicivirga linearis]MBS2100932.1 AraC family transcriptional regulator [Carboxylicivirga linearis]